MTTALATKQDIEMLRRDFDARFTLLGQEIGTLRADIIRETHTVRSDVEKDLKLLNTSMTVRLGLMLAGTASLLLAGLRWFA